MAQETVFRNGEEHTEKMDDDFLYDEKLLKDLDWSSVTHMKNNVSIHNPGDGLVVRPLRKSDFEKGFPKILSQMTVTGDVSLKSFQDRFDELKRCKDHYYITVIENTIEKKIIASATLQIELKFTRGCCKRGRLEDVVVDDNYRGKQLGKLLVTTIVLLSKSIGCYKITLDCSDEVKDYYVRMGFKGEKNICNTLAIRF